MLDTLIVVLMKGIRIRLLRALMAFLFLCAGISALLLLITLSGLRWPGMTATASSVEANPPGAGALPPAAPIPHILHNPCVASPTVSATPHTPHSLNKNRLPSAGQLPGSQLPSADSQSGSDQPPADPNNSGSIFGQGPSVLGNILNPIISKLHSKQFLAKAPPESCLSNSLANVFSKGTLATLGSLIWLLPGMVSLLMLGGLGLFVTGQRRRRP